MREIRQTHGLEEGVDLRVPVESEWFEVSEQKLDTCWDDNGDSRLLKSEQVIRYLLTQFSEGLTECGGRARSISWTHV